MKRILLAIVALVAACQRTPPPLPTLNTATLRVQVQRAIDEAQRAATAAPADAAKTLRLGMILQAHGQIQTALACYQRAHALDAQRFDTLYYLGFALAANGQKADAALRQALTLQPDSFPVALKLAEVTRDAAQARDLTARYPAEATAHYLLGRSQSGPAAIAAYQRALELFPRYGAAQFALAAEYRQAGQPKEAQAALTNYERDKLVVPPLDDPEGLALAELATSAPGLLRRAQRAEAAGSLPQALALHREALQQDPHLVDAWINLISLHARLSQAPEAEAAYRRAVALAPARADAHYNYGVFCLQLQRFAEARAAFTQTTKLDPRNADAWLNLGSLAGQQGDLDQAAAAFENAIAARPGFARAHYHLGQIHAIRRNFTAARAAFTTARASADPQLAASIDQDLARLP